MYFRTQPTARAPQRNRTSFEFEFEKLEDRRVLSTIQIIAAGTTNLESVELQIDSQTVKSWNNLGGDAYGGQFVTLNHNTANDVTAGQLRVAFTNDFYDPANDIDRNVRIDAIVIDGVRYETEAPDVYSTGTWKPQDGINPGFRKSEYLHTDGYFQYADAAHGGSNISIRASGDQGEELFQLWINGAPVANYAATTDSALYGYQASSSITPDQVRVVFTNDLYDAANDIDRNLNVDFISIDGTVYQTEDPTVYSSGTWKPADGITPGFRESETLHTNGFFQYAAVGQNNGSIALDGIQYTVSEDGGSVAVQLSRTGGSDGLATVNYQTVSNQATEGDDFIGTDNGTVVFADGQTQAAAVIPIIDDGLIEPTESFSISLFNVEGAGLGFPRTATITIVDDELGSDLVGHWKLDETTIGATVVDSSGYGNNGSTRNMAPPSGPSADTPNVDSPNTGSFQFDGTNDFISVAPSPSLDLSGGKFTQSVWVLPDLTDDRFHGVLGFENGGPEFRYPGIWVKGNRIHAGFGDGTRWGAFRTDEVLTQGVWNHIATTFDGVTYKAFANGIEIYSSNHLSGRLPLPVQQVDIGRVDTYFPGLIDDARIYNRNLSPIEIAELIDGADVPPIPNSGEFVAQTVVSGLQRPLGIEWLPDGRMLVAEDRGVIRIVNADGSIAPQPFLDIRSRVNSGSSDRGMLGFTIHPNFAVNRYLYVSYTYDPPEVNSQSGDAGPDGDGARVARISRFRANDAWTFVDPASEFVLVGKNSTYENIGTPNRRPTLVDPASCMTTSGDPVQDCIPSDELSHTIGDLEFGTDGYLYASSGDAGSYGRVDPVNLRSLDVDSLAGKILRINSISGKAPADNPFFDGNLNSNRSKVFSLGLRNPYRTAINPNTGELYIGDVGWTQWEEINTGRGANFGWPAFEGGNGASLPTGGYRNLPQVQAYYATNPDVTAPAWSRLHSDGARAIIMGDFIQNSVYPQSLENRLVFSDAGDGVIRLATIQANGSIGSVDVYSTRLGVLIEFKMSPDGYMYFADIIAGTVGRLVVSQSGAFNVSGTEAVGAPVASAAQLGDGSGVTIAMIDTGIDLDHSELAQALWVNPGEIADDGIDNDGNGFVDDVHGYDFVDQDGQPWDAHGHGTLIASVVVAADDGVGPVGVAPGARLMVVRAADSFGQATVDSLAQSIHYAVDNGAQVIGLPWEGSYSTDLTTAIAYAQENDVLVVTAAGNGAVDEPSYPAQLSSWMSHVLSAGATGSDGVRLPESNQVGDSAAVQLDAMGIGFGALPDDGYGTYRGTSVSAANLVGAAAIIRAANPGLSAAQVRQVLVSSASLPAAGSDSAGSLDLFQAIELANRSDEFVYNLSGTTLAIRGTTYDDEIVVLADQPLVIFEGIEYELTPNTTITEIVINGGDGDDRLTLIGTSDDEIGYARPGFTSLKSANLEIYASDFHFVSLDGQGGVDRVTFVDSSDDDQLQVDLDQLSLQGSGYWLAATGFEKNQIRASQGQDQAIVRGSTDDDRLVIGASFVRLVGTHSRSQLINFDSVVSDLGSGFDQALVFGSHQQESLRTTPDQIEFTSSQIVAQATDVELTTSYALGGQDTLTILDDAQDNTLNARPGNVLFVGNGYRVRAYQYEAVTVTSTGGNDRATLTGSSGDDVLTSGGDRSRLAGNDYFMEVVSFSSVLAFGNGGRNSAWLSGDNGNDSVFVSPDLVYLQKPVSSVSIREFEQVSIDGGGGEDHLNLVDSRGDDRLRLSRNQVEWISPGWVLSIDAFENVRARSLIDQGSDTIEVIDQPLDYLFEAVGDWVWL